MGERLLKLVTDMEINDLLIQAGIDDDNGYRASHTPPGSHGTNTHDWVIWFRTAGSPETFLDRLKDLGYKGSASIEAMTVDETSEIEDADVIEEIPPGVPAS